MQVLSIPKTLGLWSARHRRRVVWAAIAGAILYGGLAFCCFPRIYESSVVVIPNKSLMAPSMSVLGGLIQSDDTSQSMYTDVLHSADILDRLFEEKFRDDKRINRKPLDLRRRAMAGRVTVRKSKGGAGMMIAVRATGGTALRDLLGRPSRATAAAVRTAQDSANWLQEQLRDALSTMQVTGAAKGVDFLERSRADLELQAEGLESEAAAVIEASIESSASPDATQAAAALLEAQGELVRQRKTLSALESVTGWMGSVEQRLPQMVVVGETRTAAPVLSGLRSLESDASSRIASLRQDGASDEHPGILEARSLLDTVRQEISRIESADEGTVVSSTTTGVNALHDQIAAMKLTNEGKARETRASVDALAEQCEHLQAAARFSAGASVRLQRLDAKAKALREGVLAATAKLQELEAQKAMESFGFVVLDRADVSAKVFPSTTRAGLSGLVLGAVLVLAWSVWRDRRGGLEVLVYVDVADDDAVT